MPAAPVDVPPATALALVGVCNGVVAIDAAQVDDYHRPFGVAAAVGALLTLCVLVAEVLG